MAQKSIPEDVLQFLAKHVHSIEQLEILLLLSGSPEKRWSAAEVYRVVLSSERSVEQILERLCIQELARKPDPKSNLYQYSPATEEQRKVVEKIASLYRERPVSTIQAIYAPSISEIEEFAKAFRLRKEGK